MINLLQFNQKCLSVKEVKLRFDRDSAMSLMSSFLGHDERVSACVMLIYT